MRQLLALMLISVVIGLISACGASATATPLPTATPIPPTATPVPPEPNAVSYNAVNYAFAGPATLPSGLTEITLTNQGDELHHQQLIKLPEGMGPGDFLAGLEELLEAPEPPPGLEFAGGVSVLSPGASSTTTIDLAAGSYMMLCFLPNAEGIPHVALGMFLPLTVTPSTAPAAQEPEPSLTMGMVDFGFELSGPISAGPQVIEVTNDGNQLHEFITVRLDPGTTGEEFLQALGAFIEGTATGPLPGEALGGLQAVGPGGRGYFNINFTPGDYLVFCPIDDAETGAPHFALGMLHQFTIQ